MNQYFGRGMSSCRSLVLLFTVLLSLSGFTLQAVAATKIKMSHFLPAKHGFQQDVLEPLAQELWEQAGVETEIYGAGSAFGKVNRQADQVRSGVIDIAIGLRGIPRGRFPASSVVELPFVVQNADSGSKALWQLYKEGDLGSEYKDFKVLALYTHHGGLIHTRDKPVRVLTDLKGLRLRTPSAAISSMLESQGASPVGMPPSQIYENLQKGVIDGLVATWDLIGAVKANELLKYHTDARAYTAAFYVVMNKKKYDSLPANVKAVLDGLTGDAMVAKFGDWWDQWDQRGYDEAKKRGNEIITVTDETRKQWKLAMQPMVEAYLEGLKKQGVDNPQELYEKAISLVSKYESEERAKK